MKLLISASAVGQSLASVRKNDEAMRQEMERQGFITFLCEEFLAADSDNNGVLDRCLCERLLIYWSGGLKPLA